MNSAVHKKIYKTVLDVLTERPMLHKSLIEEAVSRLYVGIDSEGQVGEFTEIRGLIGAVVAEMRSDGAITFEGGIYSVGASGAIPLKMERCEKELVALLSEGAKTKQDLRMDMRRLFKTDSTASESDDMILYTYMGQVLRRLTDIGVIELVEGKYTLREQTS